MCFGEEGTIVSEFSCDFGGMQRRDGVGLIELKNFGCFSSVKGILSYYLYECRWIPVLTVVCPV